MQSSDKVKITVFDSGDKIIDDEIDQLITGLIVEAEKRHIEMESLRFIESPVRVSKHRNQRRQKKKKRKKRRK